MVFDWFRRAAAKSETAPQESPAAVDPQDQRAADSDQPSPAQDGSHPEASGAPAVSASPEDESQAPVPPPVGAVDQAALDWARQAYARLKAQQEGQSAAPAIQPVSPPAEAMAAPAAPMSSAPPAESLASPTSALDAGSVAASDAAAEPAPLPEQAQGLPDGPASAASPAAELSAASAETVASSAPFGDSTTVPDTAAPSPGLSLLERAAAQRQQRLQELSAPPVPATATAAPALSQPPAEPTAPAPVVEDSSEPSLGAFDDTFTWSAEVLAAQGRKVEEISLEEIDWLGRLRQGLEKTRRNFVSQLLENLGDDPLTPEVLDDLETTLLRADVGVQATDQVLDALRRRLNQEVVDPAEGLRFLKQQLRDLLEAPIRASEAPLLVPQRGRLNVWLMVGVNGVGKTTTLGKLANLAVRSGYTCLIAAADTFRAAAVKQVQVWGERSDVPVVSNPSSNADPAAVVYDAIGAARARGTELVLVDTAGRLQTKHNLMEELSKVRRIIDKLAPEAAVESLLVLDASQGQNGLRQAMAFASAAGLTGVVITKLDGSARGGVALAVASEADLPIRFIGAGEGIRDLRPFNSFEFVEALLAGTR